jgi:AraC-like DNA-binding protein
MTTPGGLGAFTPHAASTFADHVVPLGVALDLHETELIEHMTVQPDQESRVQVLVNALEEMAVRTDPQRVRLARRVAEVARLAETNRTLRRLVDLCDSAEIGPRQLQRLFLEYAGVPPVWVLRRYRLIDAAEAVKDGQHVSWASVAADLGHADQAHLSRDFRAVIGKTPTAYAAAQSSEAAAGTRPQPIANQIAARIAQMRAIPAVLADAIPENRSQLYSHLGLVMAYDPRASAVIVTIRPLTDMYVRECPKTSRANCLRKTVCAPPSRLAAGRERPDGPLDQPDNDRFVALQALISERCAARQPSRRLSKRRGRCGSLLCRRWARLQPAAGRRAVRRR